MKKTFPIAAVGIALTVATESAQQGAPPDTPAVTVRGQLYTPRSILTRNMGTEEDQTTAFTPHEVIATATTSVRARSART